MAYQDAVRPTTVETCQRPPHGEKTGAASMKGMALTTNAEPSPFAFTSVSIRLSGFVGDTFRPFLNGKVVPSVRLLTISPCNALQNGRALSVRSAVFVNYINY